MIYPKENTWDIVFDIESNNLLDKVIDYSAVPYKLTDEFKMHCIVVDIITHTGKQLLYGFHDGPTYVFDGRPYREVVGGVEYVLEGGYEPVEYIHRPLASFPDFLKVIPKGSVVRGHNIINFDLLALKLYFGIPYQIEVDPIRVEVDGVIVDRTPLGDDRWDGKHIQFDDTLVRAKTLNPDRFGGNSLDALSAKCSIQKIQFRKHLPNDARFMHFAADMLYYNIFDCKSNRQVSRFLDAEMTEFNWGAKWFPAIKLEKGVADVITRQSHRGFKYDVELAKKNLAELDQMMEERRLRVEPILPKKIATKGFQQQFTPPKIQFKQNGEPSSNLLKFAAKLGGEVVGREFHWEGKVYPLPLPQEPLKTTEDATINDTTHIKNWLVGIGWRPLEYKMKDITVDSKKIKRTPEKLAVAVERYITESVESAFIYDRLVGLVGLERAPHRDRMTKAQGERMLRAELTKRLERGSGVKVKTNPSFTVGQEKEICPNLIEFVEQNPQYKHILDIVEYLTYRHRRNSILGGGTQVEDFEIDDEQTAKGFLANVRSDGRISTPADTCGCPTSRMKHRLVANVPRVTSLFGEPMRAQFGVDAQCFQIGYDFDSLEARDEAHYCWEFEEGEEKDYCNSLLRDKPHDVHTMMAAKISTIIGREFARTPAKSVKYGLIRPM